MIAANYSELRTDLKKFLDDVEDNNETLVVKRANGKGAVILSLAEYNSMIETMHLLSSEKNAGRLFKSIKQMKEGKSVNVKLTDLK